MSYSDKNLLPNEELLFRTKKHPIIFLYPLIVLIAAVYVSQQMAADALFIQLSWVLPLIALGYGASVALEYITSDFTVTNRRVLMREGFFTRHATELRMQTISQVNIDQGLIGQLLNYGTVSLNAFGAFDSYTLIAKPYEFRRYINEQLDKTTQ